MATYVVEEGADVGEDALTTPRRLAQHLGSVMMGSGTSHARNNNIAQGGKLKGALIPLSNKDSRRWRVEMLMVAFTMKRDFDSFSGPPGALQLPQPSVSGLAGVGERIHEGGWHRETQ